MKKNWRRGAVLLGGMLAIGVAGVIVAGAEAAGQEAGSGAGAPAATEHNNVRAAVKWKRFEYLCAGEAKVTVYLRDTTAKVSYANHLYMMRQTVSADGNRYSDGKVLWWGKGTGGFLQEDTPDGDGKMLVEGCNLQKPVATGTLTGTVSYLVRMALPPEALIEVKLQDVSLADAPAAVIAEEKIVLGERQVPVPFTLKFDARKIDAKHTYAVSARILVEGQERFASEMAYRVLTQGNPSTVEVMVKPVAKKAP